MTAGFQAFTDSGLVQIDGTTQNYALRQTLSITTAGGDMTAGKSNAGTQYTLRANLADFTISASLPLVVLYCPSAYATILRCTNNGNGTWTVRVWSNTATTLTVYIFDQASAAAPGGIGYGLQVFDGNGVLIADVRQRLARVIDTQVGNINNTSAGWGQWNQIDTQTHSWNYPTVSKIGVGAIGTAFVSSPTGGSNNGWYDMSSLQTSGNTVNFLWQYYAQGNTSHPGNNTCFGSQFNWRFMAVDLSNL
jgi:hypothetical protein